MSLRINTPSHAGEYSTIIDQNGELSTWLFTDSGIIAVETPELDPLEHAELIVATEEFHLTSHA